MRTVGEQHLADVLMRCTIVGLTLASGCASWRAPVDEPSRSALTASQMSPDSVGLDYGFIRVVAEQIASTHQIWQEIDETRIAPLQRRALQDNGLRVGIVGEQLPTPLRQILDKPLAADNPSLDLAFEMDANGHKQRASNKSFRHLHSRTGQRNQLVTTDLLPQMNVLVQHESDLTGRTFRDAQCVFMLKTFPLSDGRVRLQLTPEIHHDSPRPEVIAETGIWRFDTSKKREINSSLQIDAVLSPGESLLIAPTASPRGLGQQFLAPHKDDTLWKHKMLVLRLAQTQHDPLFSDIMDATLKEAHGAR